jgi:conjugal transfer pilus assembly protein TraV
MLAERRTPSGLARAATMAAVGLAATQLAACTSLFGGNIKGSFACSAPGGTCAPSTLIDDQALSVIQNARPMTPAGPYIRQPAAAKAVTASYVPSGSGRLASADNGMVHRERRVLKVVFPSFVDGGGNLHEPRIVHAVVDDGAWMQLSSGEPNLGDQVEGRAISLASAAYTPAPAAPAPVSESAVAPVAAQVNSPSQALPSPEAVAAARAKAAALKSGNAVDAIRAEVQARLAHTAKAQAGAVPAPASAAVNAPANAATKPANGPAAFPAKVEE